MTAAGSAGEAVTPGQAATELIAAERLRQIAQEGYTSEHDREHGSGDLAVAGAFYAVCAARPELADAVRSMLWPWGWRFSGGDAVRMLTKAGALIAAEIDRLQGTAQAAIAAQQPHVCEPLTVQPSDDVKPAPGVILDRLRAAVANHEAPLHRQWYVDEHIIDCDPAEFWAVLAAALKQPQPASSTLRADLEATVKTWLEESTPYPDESAEDTARRGGFGWCASELSQLLAQHPEPQPAPELAAAEHRAELEAAVRELVGQHCRTVGPCRFCDGNTAGIMQLADTYAGLPS